MVLDNLPATKKGQQLSSGEFVRSRERIRKKNRWEQPTVVLERDDGLPMQ